MSTILEKCNAINAEKQEKIVPENIKKGVEIFGVVGSAESGNAEMMSKITGDTSYTRIGTFLTKITDIDTSNLTSMESFFSDCHFLREVPTLNTSNVSYMGSMFYRCFSLIEIPPIDTSNVTTMNSTFQYCESLETIPELNAQKAYNISSFLSGTGKLKNLGGFIDLGKGFTIKSTNHANQAFSLTSKNVTYESLMNIINKLYDLNLTYDVANGGTLYTQRLNLTSTNLAKLTAEEIAIATNKGWNVS